MDIERRLQEHNAGLSNYTSKHIPWELVFFEEFSTRTEALEREKWYKTGAGRDWIKKQINEYYISRMGQKVSVRRGG